MGGGRPRAPRRTRARRPQQSGEKPYVVAWTTCMTPSYVMSTSAINIMLAMTRITIASFLYFRTTQSITDCPRNVEKRPQAAKAKA